MAKIKSYDSLSALYSDNEVAKDIQQEIDFTIHRMQDVHAKPVQSPVFRANYFSFILVKSGKSYYTIDSHKFEVGPQTLYFTNPGHLKSFGIEEVVHGYIITTTERFLKENLNNDVFGEFQFLLSEIVPPTKLSTEQTGRLLNFCEQIETAYNSNSQLQKKILSSLFVVYLLNIKEILMANEKFVIELDRDSEIAQQFKKDIERVLRSGSIGQDDLKVSAFAKAQSLHPAYFSTVIKAKTGYSASHWINKKMIEESKALLKNTSQPIKSIAYQMGYSEPTHFTKFFKKATQMTPRQYKNQHS
ncbi:helix-turn-helix domain-containing protein [Flagellimonas meridianipacifica]|uniref:AraC-like DNA-binding protein n=1 Tax=Flagellimonas meridianipacifica TaxID=1080225 RepID=A0A2T0MJ36_9FLAO|nr:AraC family transcriptional regulator [Allomuricauda pacifica]PRX57597.1 AraC-like DNA-binding protein [Allomuricauda pacifica]